MIQQIYSQVSQILDLGISPILVMAKILNPFWALYFST